MVRRLNQARLTGIGAHHSARRQSDEWFTPPSIFEALSEAGFAFDLDPCAPVEGIPYTPAKHEYSLLTDGLVRDWHGQVWLNPPYSELEPWMDRLAEHGQGIALTFARTETKWFFDAVWPHATALLFLAGRITFWQYDEETEDVVPSLAGHSSGGPSVLIAYGDHAAGVLERAELAGAFMAGPAQVRR